MRTDLTLSRQNHSAIIGPAQADREPERRLDVVIVGAGQAGLASAYFLRQSGCSFLLLEKHPRLGDSWRKRYDSLKLFSPRCFCSLPGAELNGDPEGYPNKDELADYLESYALRFRLPVALDEAVGTLERGENGFRLRTTRGRTLQTSAVIIAAGPFQRSIVPDFAKRLSPRVRQFTADRYRNPAEVPPGRVLVVGAGASGRQLARELARERETWLAVGGRMTITSQRILGKDAMWWSDRIGALWADKDSWFGRFVRRNETFSGKHLRLSSLRRDGVRIAARAVDANERRIRFADGTESEFSSVIWAVGYRDDISWFSIPGAVGGDGRYRQERGESPVPGLFHVGRRWQNNLASALVCGVGRDAERIADKVDAYLATVSAENQRV